MKNRVALISLILLFSACATNPNSRPPTGARFSEIVLPKPSEGNAMLVFFRDRTISILLNSNAAKIAVDGKIQLSLPIEGFAYIETPSGKHDVELKWDSWQIIDTKETLDLNENTTYYYQLSKTSNNSLGIGSVDSILAKGGIEYCCRLTNELTTVTARKTPLQIRNQLRVNQLLDEEIDDYFSEIRTNQNMQRVVDLLGEPNKVFTDKTGKSLIPFYYGADVTRIVFSYTGIGTVTLMRTSTRAYSPWVVHEFEYDRNAI